MVHAVVTRRRFILSPEAADDRDASDIFSRDEMNVCAK